MECRVAQSRMHCSIVASMSSGSFAVGRQIRYTADGKLVIRELTLRPVSGLAELTTPVPDGGISKDILRRIPLRADLRYIRAVVRTQRPDPPDRRSKGELSVVLAKTGQRSSRDTERYAG